MRIRIFRGFCVTPVQFCRLIRARVIQVTLVAVLQVFSLVISTTSQTSVAWKLQCTVGYVSRRQAVLQECMWSDSNTCKWKYWHSHSMQNKRGLTSSGYSRYGRDSLHCGMQWSTLHCCYMERMTFLKDLTVRSWTTSKGRTFHSLIVLGKNE